MIDGVVNYECEFTGLSYALHVRNGLHIPSMKNHLIPPIMMQLEGITVNECPKFFSRKPSVEDHSIYFVDHELRFLLLVLRNNIISTNL